MKTPFQHKQLIFLKNLEINYTLNSLTGSSAGVELQVLGFELQP